MSKYTNEIAKLEQASKLLAEVGKVCEKDDENFPAEPDEVFWKMFRQAEDSVLAVRNLIDFTVN